MKKITYLIALFLIASTAQAQLCNPNFTHWVDSNNLVTFTNLTPNNSAFTYEWDFGDSSAVDTSFSPTHQYSAPGVYLVTLSVDSFNFPCVSNSMKMDTIYVNYCNAQFGTQVAASGTVTFLNYSSAYKYGVGYDWDFGDNSTYSTGSKANIAHTYASSGTYVVTLSLFDSLNNCRSLYMDSILVQMAPAQCMASYTVSKDTSVAFGVILTNTSSNAASHSYSWNFGDNNSGTGRTPSHQYQSFGSYVVCLTISDSLLNCTSTFCDTLGMDSLGNLKAGFGLIVKDPVIVGINEAQNMSGLNIFPNPASNQISLDLRTLDQRVTVSILDISGRVVFENSDYPAGNIEIIDISSLKNGIYFMLLNDGNSQRMEKLIKSN